MHKLICRQCVSDFNGCLCVGSSSAPVSWQKQRRKRSLESQRQQASPAQSRRLESLKQRANPAQSRRLESLLKSRRLESQCWARYQIPPTTEACACNSMKASSLWVSMSNFVYLFSFPIVKIVTITITYNSKRMCKYVSLLLSPCLCGAGKAEDVKLIRTGKNKASHQRCDWGCHYFGPAECGG